jgi:hypothetical protein
MQNNKEVIKNSQTRRTGCWIRDDRLSDNDNEYKWKGVDAEWKIETDPTSNRHLTHFSSATVLRSRINIEVTILKNILSVRKFLLAKTFFFFK